MRYSDWRHDVAQLLRHIAIINTIESIMKSQYQHCHRRVVYDTTQHTHGGQCLDATVGYMLFQKRRSMPVCLATASYRAGGYITTSMSRHCQSDTKTNRIGYEHAVYSLLANATNLVICARPAVTIMNAGRSLISSIIHHYHGDHCFITNHATRHRSVAAATMPNNTIDE